MFCPGCGVENPEGTHFCKNCGQSLDTGDQAAFIPPPSVEPPPVPDEQSSGDRETDTPAGSGIGEGAGTPPPVSGSRTEPEDLQKVKEEWWQSLLFCLLLSLFCCWPVGLILYWTNPVASIRNKILFTLVFVILAVLILVAVFLFVYLSAQGKTHFGGPEPIRFSV